jgi:hypothetical protein
MLVAWLGFSVARQSAASGSASSERQVVATPRTMVPSPGKKAPSVLSSAPAPGLAPQAPAPVGPEVVAIPVTAAVSGVQTEPAINPSVLIAPALPVESPHVPFLQSVMAASRPGASGLGNGYGAGHFGGSAFGSGGGGLGGGGAVPDAVGLPIETLLGGAGNERVGLLGHPAFDDTGTGAGNSNDTERKDAGSNGNSSNGGSNDGGSNDGGPNDGGSNDGDPNPGGPGNGGSNDGGSNEGGPNDGGSNDGGSNDGDPNPGGSSEGDSTKNGDVNPPGGGSGNVVDPWTVDPVDDNTDQDPGPQGGTRSPAVNVPEPGLMLLSGLGIAGALVRRVRARRG